MSTARGIGSIALTLALGLGLLWPAVPPAAANPAAGIAIIVHASNPIRSLTARQVADMYLLRQQFWGLSVRITIVVQRPGGAAHAILLKRVLDMSASDLNRLYLEHRFRGTLAARVQVVSTDAEVRSIVAATPTAIGYVLEPAGDASVKSVLQVASQSP